MRVKDIIDCLEEALPLWLQESWDNSGLQIGDKDAEVTRALIALDVTEEVVAEAAVSGCNLIISHHPLLFKGLKRIGTSSYIERAVRLAIKHDIAIYSAHTNADSSSQGLNVMLASELGLINVRPLEHIAGSMSEIITFVPREHLPAVQEALWSAGAGHIAQYDKCSFSCDGVGTFRPLEGATPFVGTTNTLERAEEVRLSMIFGSGDSRRIIAALHAAHPYEVPAYSIVQLGNPLPSDGYGVVGDLPEPIERTDYLRLLRDYFDTDKLMYAGKGSDKIRRVALCGGAGAFLWSKAHALGADIFVTGEAKYNDYLDVEGLTMATVGHYESEVIATRLFANIISRKFPTFAHRISDIDNKKIKTI